MRRAPLTHPRPHRRDENLAIWVEEITVPMATGRAVATFVRPRRGLEAS
jgi:hypothetical protein